MKVDTKDINSVEDDIVIFTGVYAGYTKTQLTLYNKIGKDGYSYFDFWTTSENNGYGYKFNIAVNEGIIGGFGIDQRQNKTTPMLVRPILAN